MSQQPSIRRAAWRMVASPAGVVRPRPVAPLRRLVARLAPGWAARRRRAHTRRFYGQLVAPGGLCFDVGACHGRVTAALRDVGARVVAVEANPALAAALTAAFASDDGVVVAPVALGATAGVATLLLANEPTVGTLSPRFAATFATAALRYQGTVEVEVSTLDALIARHGRPDYVKIDVEGGEPDVLAGLREAIAAVSFEANAPLIDIALAAVDRLAALGDYRFVFSPYEELRPVAPPLAAAAFVQALPGWCRAGAAATGDVYATLSLPAASATSQ